MRRTRDIFVLGVLAAALAGSSCGGGMTPVAPSVTPTTTSSSIPLPLAITTQDAFSLIQANKTNPGLVILDVRTAAEFSGGHIANAVNIDYYSPDFRANVGTLDRNNRYVVYCRTGIRGAAATQIMQEIGFTQVQNLTGGLDQWVLDGYPTVT
jgi:rhodanese-related sulfurtransferase